MRDEEGVELLGVLVDVEAELSEDGESDVSRAEHKVVVEAVGVRGCNVGVVVLEG